MNLVNQQDLIEENNRLLSEIKRLKEDLAEGIYKKLFEASPDIIIQVDPQYKIIISHFPTIPLDLVAGNNLFDVTPPHLHDLMRDALDRVFLKDETISFESDAELLGQHKYFLNYVSPLKDSSGKIHSAYFISREITQLKLSEKIRKESEQTLLALFESSQHIHILLDKEGRLKWFNQRAIDTALLLFRDYLKAGTYMKDYLPESFAVMFDGELKKALAGEVRIYNRHYVLDEDRKQMHLEMMLQPIYDERKQPIGISLVGVETTDRRAHEENLEKINRELVQQNLQLNQYSYIISHNLRGPIVTLLGLANVFEQSGHNEAFRAEIVGHIKTSALHLDNTISDLNMVLSQADGRSVARIPIDFAQVLQVVKDLLATQIEYAEGEIEADFSRMPVFTSVKSYIQSIFMNLISNSLKYKKMDTPSRIFVKSSSFGENWIMLEFSDNGIGIDLEKNAEKLFGFYKRFHVHVEGKGLGLHLVKTQVELLGGKIEVHSQVNKGATFKIFLPVR